MNSLSQNLFQSSIFEFRTFFHYATYLGRLKNIDTSFNSSKIHIPIIQLQNTSLKLFACKIMAAKLGGAIIVGGRNYLVMTRIRRRRRARSSGELGWKLFFTTVELIDPSITILILYLNIFAALK